MSSASHPRSVIALFLPSLETGGAELQALEQVRQHGRGAGNIVLISIRKPDPSYMDTENLRGIELISLGGRNPISNLWRLLKVLRLHRVAILHSLLLATHIYSLIARLLCPKTQVVIGLLDSLPDRTLGVRSFWERIKVRALGGCVRGLGFLASCYVANSQAAARLARSRVLKSRIHVIPNGVDGQRFAPDPHAGSRLRKLSGAPAQCRLVGMVANFSIYKDHATFIQAARRIADVCGDVHFITIGNDRTVLGKDARRAVAGENLEGVFHFLGHRADVHQLLPGLDVFVSSSISEGFSNAICEAMACGVPGIVTDVGDSALIVGDTGIVVPPASPEPLAEGVLQLLALSGPARKVLGMRARKRIEDNFGMGKMVDAHRTLYRSLLGGPVPTADLNSTAAHSS